MSDADRLDPRVGELLSAYVDGAVDDESRATAEAWIERSAAARAEHAALVAVKSAVTSLPPVEPPAGFFEAMLERGSPAPAPGTAANVVPLASRRRARLGWGAAAAAAAAAWVVVAGGRAEVVDPPLDDVEEVALRQSFSRQVRVERDDGARFALARQEGDPAWDDLPRGVREGDTWVDLTTGEGFARVVVDRGDVVYTLASEELDAEALLAIAEDLPDDGGVRGPLDRVRRACEELLEALGVGD